MKRNGFTLIELLIVTAVVSVLAVLSAQIVVSVLRSQNKTAAINNVRQNGDHVLNAIERDIRQSESIRYAWPGYPFFTAIKLVIATSSGTATVVWACKTVAGGPRYIGRQVGSGPLIPVRSNDPDTGTDVETCAEVFRISPEPMPITDLVLPPWRVKISFDLENARNLPDISELKANQHFQATFSSR